MNTTDRRGTHAQTPVASDAPDQTVWIRPKALAHRWGCSISQVHRIAGRCSLRRCVLGGTGANGASSKNAMVLYSMTDVIALEARSIV